MEQCFLRAGSTARPAKLAIKIPNDSPMVTKPMQNSLYFGSTINGTAQTVLAKTKPVNDPIEKQNNITHQTELKRW
ncbi:hypothetical protein P5673_002259 [Acropora cervicornis]|uniref:Uncharacterized protein n=1 Tax=Acropora cervicornis TaxID=6130 RepID=A0AAD9R543_ACRCE|nr:hypothetical protein P5673_002259 [Acropora cervicornis]